MRILLLLAGLWALISTANAQPDDVPGFAKPPQAAAPAPEMTPEQKRVAWQELMNKIVNPANKVNLTTPEATVRSYVWSLFKADMQLTRECVNNPLPYDKLKGIEAQMKKDMEKAIGTNIKIFLNDFHSYIQGDLATVTFSSQVIVDFMQPTVVQSVERFHLRLKDGSWLILPDYGRPKTPLMGPQMIVEDSIVSSLTVLFDPVAMPQEASQANCQANLKEMGLALMQFAQDFNEGLPVGDNWQQELLPYCKTDAIFKCPADEKATYGRNTLLRNLADIEEGEFAKIIMAYEGKDNQLEFRHQNKTLTNILFADGHVKTFDKAALDAALKDGSVKWKP